MASVDFQRQDYSARFFDWELVRDTVSGQRRVKEMGTRYLPRPNPSDKSTEATERYQSYLERAQFYNATGRTLAGLVGVAFGRWPNITVPAQLEYVRADCDGAGLPIVGQSQMALSHILMTGRAGLLVDYPAVQAPQSRADMARGEIQATISLFRAEEIQNWQLDRIGGKTRLTMLTLREVVEECGHFEVSNIDQWRELRLGVIDPETEDASRPYYFVRLWRKPSNTSAPEVWDTYIPTDGAGNRWSEIPFQFIGATNNDFSLDRAPLLDLATLNIGHYRNSADYEESCFFAGQPTYAVTGLDEAWANRLEERGYYVGSRAIMPLPEGADLKIVQASANPLPFEAMKHKEAQMIALGARIMQPGDAVKTATQARDDAKAAYSVLSLSCDNVSMAYTQALKWAARFMAAPDAGCSFAIDTDFTGLMADPQLVTALVGAWQSGAMPDSDLWKAMRTLGLIDSEKSDEQVRGEIEASGSGLGLNT